MLLFLSCPIMSIYDYHHSEYINEKMSNSQIFYILHMCIMSPVFNQTLLESEFKDHLLNTTFSVRKEGNAS